MAVPGPVRAFGRGGGMLNMTDTRRDATVVLNALVVIVALCAAGSSHVTQAAEPTGTLTPACEGTAIDKTDPFSEEAKPEPVSMGLMIDFTSKTVAGFEHLNPVLGGAPVKIIIVDKTTIGFSGVSAAGGTAFGTIDRITGDVEAATEIWSHETQPHKLVGAKGYSLKCKPTQRMF